MTNTVKRKLDPNSPLHIPIVLNVIALVVGGLAWMFSLPDKEIPVKNLLKP
jgi:hypothetical protein